MKRTTLVIMALAIALAMPTTAWADGAWTTPEEFQELGVLYDDDGTWYTYYNDEDAPDGFDGYLDDDGVWRDWDGYVAVAAEWWQYGELVDTPMGMGRCYDYCPSGAIDVWTCWE